MYLNLFHGFIAIQLFSIWLQMWSHTQNTQCPKHKITHLHEQLHIKLREHPPTTASEVLAIKTQSQHDQSITGNISHHTW